MILLKLSQLSASWRSKISCSLFTQRWIRVYYIIPSTSILKVVYLWKHYNCSVESEMACNIALKHFFFSLEIRKNLIFPFNILCEIIFNRYMMVYDLPTWFIVNSMEPDGMLFAVCRWTMPFCKKLQAYIRRVKFSQKQLTPWSLSQLPSGFLLGVLWIKNLISTFKWKTRL